MRKITIALQKLLFFYFLLLISSAAFSQSYQPTWESLDSRPVPKWFSNDKFGIFIHWGVYAVPGYTPKGRYAEWYQESLLRNDSATVKYHKNRFGDRSYYDLANDFKAELFNPDEWAKLIEKSGAKYIVLTSKHHDGFCLWPSKTANQTWNFPWNAADVGPKRDLLGDLFKAVRKTSVHAGMYYSLYEWFNPLWKKDPERYASEHMWPQMKELINTYQPDVFWTDGDWDAPAETWKSREFLTWLYNESPVKNSVVTYDRWGSGVRFHHGTVYTPEYQPDLDFENHAWEESRGMGFSYGYNREEDSWDYNSTQSLVLALVDKVSRGGNFLLDIGPDEHGKIPPIMQERLLGIGDWMKLNGEAIYGTSRWKISSQGKDVFFTYKPEENVVYAIFPQFPSDRKLVLNDISIPNGTTISFLATGEKVSAQTDGSKTIIALPEYDPNKISAPYAYVVKIEGFGKFSSKPRLSVDYSKSLFQPTVRFSAPAAGEGIRYTLDGSMPSETSTLYSGPFTVNKTCTINAKKIQQNALPSAVVSAEIKRYEWMSPVKTGKTYGGLVYKYFEPSGKIDMQTIASSPVIKKGISLVINETVKERKEKYALEFEGLIKIDKQTVYEFFLLSDDGSKLFIDGAELINNDGEHGSVEKSEKAALKKGFHLIRVVYYDAGGGNELKLHWLSPENKKQIIPGNILFHTK
jgi:alpha-L-fucosidase